MQLTRDRARVTDDQQGKYALFALIGATFLGWIIIVIFSFEGVNKLRVIGVGSMVAGASALVGAFLGFLFGVPKSLQGDQPAVTGESKSAGDQSRSGVRPNTNLEQISDWLTKILVGAGLTQLTKICEWVRALGIGLAQGFGVTENAARGLAAGASASPASGAAGAFASSTVVYFAVDGFFLAFLWARLYLGKLMTQADVESLTQQIQEVKEQTELDARALALSIKQLNPSAGSPPDSRDLSDAIKAASGPVKARIFYQAEEQRRNNWEDRDNKPKMERTIPIFRALIACDPDGLYHANHGQLGYALKDQAPPNPQEAIAELTKAIEIRGSARDHGFQMYELVRAICLIMTDSDFNAGRKSAQQVRDCIVHDLDVVASSKFLSEMVARKVDILQKWAELNEIDQEPVGRGGANDPRKSDS